MKISSVMPKSSFLSVEKDANIIATKILNNERLKRLLYYTTPDCLEKDNLTEEQTYSLIGKNIKNIPKLYIDKDLLNYVIINFDNFSMNATNPEFRDNYIEFDIVCHFSQWQLKDFQLRPYKIAAEIDAMLDKQHLTGIGTLNFLGAVQLVINNEFGGLCLMYEAIHGGEDKKHLPSPNQEERFLQDFQDMMDNSKK